MGENSSNLLVDSQYVKHEKLGNLGEEPGRLSCPGYRDQENGLTPVPYGHVVREIRHMFGDLPDGDRGPKCSP